jgi:hypothetical protein
LALGFCLTSVFGPYGQDDEYGSRAINPMELYQNQVTRAQGPFSLRMFHRSWALMFLQENISAPSVLLDFPTKDRFCEEIRREHYDVIGTPAMPPSPSNPMAPSATGRQRPKRCSASPSRRLCRKIVTAFCGAKTAAAAPSAPAIARSSNQPVETGT